MNKKIVSKFLVLALVVGIFGLVSATRVLAVFNTPATTTEIGNVAPVISSVAESWTQTYTNSVTTDARAESSTTYPTNAGTAVRFTATATDANLDGYWLAICKTDEIHAGSAGGAPTCNSVPNTWVISATAAASGNSSYVEYTVPVSGAAESNAWFAFACDNNAGSTLCSAVNQGSGASGSPFMVNHKPSHTIGTVVDSADGTIAPGDTVKFVDSADSDADVNAAQDTISIYVCPAESDMGGVTDHFDYKLHECHSAASTALTPICSATGVNPNSADATCNAGVGFVSVPTAHASDYSVKVYVLDQHDFASTDTNDKDFAVIDVPPVLGTWTTDDAITGATLLAGLSDTMDFSVAITDDNGDEDVTNVQGIFYDDDAINLASGVCTADQKNCYLQAACTLSGKGGAGTGKTALGSSNDLSAACQVTVWFNANAASNWEFHVNPTDNGLGVITSLSDTNVGKSVPAISGIGVTQASIAYGTVAIGGTSAAQTTTMENLGNQIIDVLVSGTNMTSGGNAIAAAQQKYDESNGDFDWTSAPAAYALLTSASAGTEAANGCLNRSLAVRAVAATGTENESITWKIRIPAAQPSGSYSGTNTFASTANTSCTGTAY